MEKGMASKLKEFFGMSCDSTGCSLKRPTNKPIKIKMFSDYMCAWCYLADTMLNSLKEQYNFEVEHIGFELHPTTPEQGEDMNINHPGTPQTMAYINQLGKTYGLKLCDLPILANTKKALIVGEYAKAVGKGDAYVHAMWKAYMEDGRNISFLPEIEAAAQTVGISQQEVKTALADPQYAESLQRNMASGQYYSVSSVPTFIIEDTYKVTGAQKPEVFRQIFEEIFKKQEGQMNL